MGPMVEFIAQMVEYNETLTIYQNFIDNSIFFSIFFFGGGPLTLIRICGAYIFDHLGYEFDHGTHLELKSSLRSSF